jgi:hypothetical protein
MNNLIHLESWVKPEGTNCVEIHLSKHIGLDKEKEANVIDITTDDETKGLLAKFGNGSFSKFKNYYYKDYHYSYDLSNDAQRVTKRIHTYDTNPHARIYVVGYNENVLASHRFPTTSEISNTNIVERTTFRINNRLFIYNDKVYGEHICDIENVDPNPDMYNEYIYAHYNHSPQVDLKHMQTDIERIVRQLITPPSKSDPYQ